MTLTLTGAQVLWAGGLGPGPVGIAAGRIAEAGGRAIDLSGLLVLPGIVDAHGDGFERHLAPRRGALPDLAQGLLAVEQELLANGITTAMLAQFWSWEGGMRGPEFARSLATALAAYPARADLRMSLRLELGCYRDFEAVRAFVQASGIGHVVLNDHLPHAALAKGRRVPRLEGQALKSGRSPEAHQALLEELYAKLPEAHAALPGLLTQLRAAGVRLGSHDDGQPEARAAYRACGADLAEFPLNPETARAARDAGDWIVLGAPNLVRGGSHQKGGTSARGLAEAGLCDALASDYHYPAPLGAARRLVAEGWELGRAWALVSGGPARGLGLTDRGEIALGKRADLVVAAPDLSRVHGTFVAGQAVYGDAELMKRITA